MVAIRTIVPVWRGLVSAFGGGEFRGSEAAGHRLARGRPPCPETLPLSCDALLLSQFRGPPGILGVSRELVYLRSSSLVPVSSWARFMKMSVAVWICSLNSSCSYSFSLYEAGAYLYFPA